MGGLVIGTRGSKLALRQAEWVAERLAAMEVQATIRVIRTTGDRNREAALARLGPQEGVKGIFTKEIEEALLGGGIDVAVHSLKDLPTDLDERLELACVPVRADPRDALLGRRLDELAAGDRVGTGSPRRAAQMQELAPSAELLDVRGNVDTRIRKLREGSYEAILLAAAGLERLGLESEIAEVIEPDRMVPAVGQGALGIETRAGDDRTRQAVAVLHDEKAAAEVEAERALLRALGAGCQAPVGAHATVEGGRLTLRAAVAGKDAGMIRADDAAPLGEAAELGAHLAVRLRALGADVPH